MQLSHPDQEPFTEIETMEAEKKQSPTVAAIESLTELVQQLLATVLELQGRKVPDGIEKDMVDKQLDDMRFSLDDDVENRPFGRLLSDEEADKLAEKMVAGTSAEPAVISPGWNFGSEGAVPANGKISASAQAQADRILAMSGYSSCLKNK